MSKLWTAQAADYLLTLQQLLPPGVIWTRDPDRRLTRFLYGMADEITRAHNYVTDAFEKADPQTTISTGGLLAEWEAACGLPEFGVIPVGDANRRRVLVAKLAATGGQSAAYFTALALRYGETVTVTDGPWTFYWTVAGAKIHRMDCNDPCNSYLVWWDASFDPVQFAFEKYKPAHSAIYWTP